MSEITANLAYNGNKNFERANENQEKAREGAATVLRGLWDMGAGTLGQAKRNLMGYGAMSAAAMTFIPEMVIEEFGEVQKEMKTVAARQEAGGQPRTVRAAHAENRTAREAATSDDATATPAADAGARVRTAPRAASSEASRETTREASRGPAPVAASERDSDGDNTYTVKRGDSLWKIVSEDYKARHDGALNNREILAQVNALKSQTNGDLILPGMVITLPRQ